ncbi:hypothetical protein BHM03_00020721 [Ensete ventricosum]|nr:hypothetical protein BHM03_00020721 [Ensete ventricosum]
MRLTLISSLKQVHKSIAGSPYLLLEGNPYLCRSPANTPLKIPLLDCKNSQQDEDAQKDDRQKSDQERPNENIPRNPTLPTCEERADGGPHSEFLPSVSTASDSNPTPWYFHQPENQWLVPVMSPSEGLICKPYPGPSAPTSGFLAPVYGSCTPLGVPSLAGNFMNTVYGVAAFHGSPSLGVPACASAITTNYFPTYGLPTTNPTISTSPVEQVSNLACSRPNGQIDQNCRISCNISRPRSEAISGRLWMFRASKSTELQGSSASRPCEKAQAEARHVLPLFPMAPANENLASSQLCGRDSRTRAFKVVPCNVMSPTESAARIFQSIQEERQ